MHNRAWAFRALSVQHISFSYLSILSTRFVRSCIGCIYCWQFDLVVTCCRVRVCFAECLQFRAETLIINDVALCQFVPFMVFVVEVILSARNIRYYRGKSVRIYAALLLESCVSCRERLHNSCSIIVRCRGCVSSCAQILPA